MAIEFQCIKKNGESIQLTPLIDVIFQLLVFFMLSSTFIYPSLELQLPRAEFSKHSDEFPSLVVSIEAEGNLLINREWVDDAAFAKAIADKQTDQDKRVVFINADQQVPYKRVLEVIRMCSEAGTTQINFLYQPEK